ncbi:hypothetical protein RhiirA4_482891 [Rhizophagus irregularis]|uniref:Uncharacterized protein n=1 Tax=Rhizophagus irregularis TaxID=588596 RepID=A0A2I1HLT5_9GLOM|nr:hypothetical protein RhiirA4_482891 [Rhizophagus irregularis]
MKEFIIFLDHGSYNLPDISNVTTYSSGIANLKYLEVEIMFKLWMLQTNKEIITPILDIIKSQPINNMSIHYTPTYEYLEEIIIYISKFRSKTLTRLIFNRLQSLSEIFCHLIIPLICELKSLKILDIKVGIKVYNQDLFKLLGDYLTSVEHLSFNFDLYRFDLLRYFEYFTNNYKANLKNYLLIFIVEIL